MQRVINIVERRKCDALSTGNGSSVRMEDMVRREGIPFLKIETDYSPADMGQLNTRIAVFMEMI